ncbi:MAG: hypothetical protein ACI857_002910, partial [Arenicella sp.]
RIGFTYFVNHGFNFQLAMCTYQFSGRSYAMFIFLDEQSILIRLIKTYPFIRFNVLNQSGK